MGGFTLYGPNYTFKSNNELSINNCFCLGLQREIDYNTQQFLLKNYPNPIPNELLWNLNKQYNAHTSSSKYKIYTTK
jgi:hypothetical protein